MKGKMNWKLLMAVCICMIVNLAQVHAEEILDDDGQPIIEIVEIQESIEEENENAQDAISLYRAAPQYVNAEVTPARMQSTKKEITLKANIKNPSEELLYKFVWMKDNWKEWGVIQEFSDSNTTSFTMERPGNYQFYIDVKGIGNEIQTKMLTYTVRLDLWTWKSLTTSLPSPQERYAEPIMLTADVQGDTQYLQYKFVYRRGNNWNDWGVLQEFSSLNTIKWEPKGVGNYTLYVDIRDRENRVETYSIPYSIINVRWNYRGITTNPVSVQRRGETVTIQTQTTGNTTGLQYKYVWTKDNWKEWGVIKPFSNSNTVEWKLPNKTGNYTIYVDVKDRDGNVTTRTVPYFVASQLWSYNNVIVNGGVSEQVYRDLVVQADVTGETQNLQYKYVWMKNNWSQWGVIRDFSTRNGMTWRPKEAGNYKIFVDVKAPDGQIKTMSSDYIVRPAPWKLESFTPANGTSIPRGQEITIQANTSGANSGLQYKFVYRRGNDWSDWGVIQDFSSRNSVKFTMRHASDYEIYVDIKDTSGAVFDPQTIRLSAYNYTGVSLSASSVSVSNPVTIRPVIQGTHRNLQYKYVWMKDNWKEWGVIQDFSTRDSIVWRPSSGGNYTIFVDVRSGNFPVQTQNTRLNVTLRQESVNRLLNVARRELGTVGGFKYENAVLAKGGQLTIGRGYWCGAFVWWCFDQAGLNNAFFGGNVQTYPYNLYDYYRQRGQLTTNPQPGDLVFMKWTPLQGQPILLSHVALVESVTSTHITTIEGNMGTPPAVRRYTWNRNHSAIIAYAGLIY